jgi:pimeloyl-ACP methyl ester carboxylesterase
MTARHVTAADGVPISCEVAGAGPPLVIVHGAGSGSFGFAALRPHLERRFTVWTIERRGRGASGDSDGYEIEREFEDVAGVVEAAGPGACLFGHSYGGLVSVGAARLLRELPGLVLYEGPMGGVLAAAGRIERWSELIGTGERDRVVREFLAEVGGYSRSEIDGFAATPAWELRKQVAPTVPRELRAELDLELDSLRLEALEVRTLLLLGAESPDWAVRSTEAYAQAIPGAWVHVLEGHGHGAAVSAPELVASEVAAFLLGQHD